MERVMENGMSPYADTNKREFVSSALYRGRYRMTEQGITRREFVKKAFVGTALSSGFAAAVMPVGAATIHTDSNGLIAGEVQIPTKDGKIPAYRAMPSTGGPFPVVLVVHEIFGVHEHIQDVCRRFAKHGYLAIAPALYAREGDVSTIADIGDVMKKVVSKVPDGQVMTDLDSTAEWASQSAEGDANRLGITGFCWGGRIVWLYSAHNPNVKAGVAWYGQLVGDTSELKPKNAVDIAPTLKTPVLGLYGGQDTGITADARSKMLDALKTGHSQSEIIVYPDAPHGFHADYRPSYHEADAKDGDKRMYSWFKKYGV